MPNGTRRRPVDNTQLDRALTTRLVIGVTAVFVLTCLIILAAGVWPPPPSFPISDVYETETWQQIQVEQRDELENGPISIEAAKAQIVELGLPVRESGDETAVEVTTDEVMEAVEEVEADITDEATTTDAEGVDGSETESTEN